MHPSNATYDVAFFPHGVLDVESEDSDCKERERRRDAVFRTGKNGSCDK